jgi:hypothetical protein
MSAGIPLPPADITRWTVTAPASNLGHQTSTKGHKASAAAYTPMPAAKAAKMTSSEVRAITNRRSSAFLT